MMLDEKQSAKTLAARLWRYAPLVFWIGVIIFGSSNEISASKTSRFLAPFLRWLMPDSGAAELQLVNIVIRKVGHFTVYGALALLAARAFLTSSKSILYRRWFAFSLALVALVAVLDEYNQSFLAERTGSFYDSLLDTAGGLFALVCVAAWLVNRRRNTEAPAH